MSTNPHEASPGVIFFDVVETVFSLQPIEEGLRCLGAPPGSLGHFFAAFLRDALALAASGEFLSFPQIAAGNLRIHLATLGIDVTDTQIDELMMLFGELPAHADVLPALERIRQTPYQTVLLTNGSRRNTLQLVERNALAGLVDDVISIEDFEIWKPRQALYLAAAKKHRCTTERAVLVAAHAWDVNGAISAGFSGVWFPRHEALYHPVMSPHAHREKDFAGAVARAISLLE